MNVNEQILNVKQQEPLPIYLHVIFRAAKIRNLRIGFNMASSNDEILEPCTSKSPFTCSVVVCAWLTKTRFCSETMRCSESEAEAIQRIAAVK